MVLLHCGYPFIIQESFVVTYNNIWQFTIPHGPAVRVPYKLLSWQTHITGSRIYPSYDRFHQNSSEEDWIAAILCNPATNHGSDIMLKSCVFHGYCLMVRAWARDNRYEYYHTAPLNNNLQALSSTYRIFHSLHWAKLYHRISLSVRMQ